MLADRERRDASMTGVLIGLVLPAAAVWLLLHAWRLRAPDESRAVTVALAVGGGLGAASLTTTWLVALGVGFGTPFVVADALLWTGLVLAAGWRWRTVGGPRSGVPSAGGDAAPSLTVLEWLVRGVFCVTAAVALATAIAEYGASPHGQWDAWAIWNQHARFLFRGGDQWTAALAIDWSNPDYPLLVPASVARLWAYAGAELTFAPALIGAAFGAAIVGAVMGALDLRRTRAWIAGTILLAPGTFVQQVLSQSADAPLAFFIVATLILLYRERMRSWPRVADAWAPLLAAGLLGGLAAWTKNEGALFFVIASVWLGWQVWRHRCAHQAAWWAAGAVPALLTVLWFKSTLAPTSYLLEDQSLGAVFARLLSPERHALVGGIVGEHVGDWGGPLATGAAPAVLAVAVLASARGGRAARGMVTAAGLLATGYYAVFLTTALDHTFLVTTTVDRLLVHVWPVLVLAACTLGEARPLADTVPGAGSESAAKHPQEQQQ